MCLGNLSVLLVSSPPFEGLDGAAEVIVAVIFAALNLLARTERCCDILARAP
jgi:hypothetical protein